MTSRNSQSIAPGAMPHPFFLLVTGFWAYCVDNNCSPSNAQHSLDGDYLLSPGSLRFLSHSLHHVSFHALAVAACRPRCLPARTPRCSARGLTCSSGVQLSPRRPLLTAANLGHYHRPNRECPKPHVHTRRGGVCHTLSISDSSVECANIPRRYSGR